MLKHFLQLRWFIVAFIVGSLLNAINQWEAIFSEAQDVSLPKIALTYLVPYLMSSISAWYAKPH